MSDCIFCKIGRHELNSDIVYEDGEYLAFKDINPVAPVHVLLIPKKHVSSLLDEGADAGILGRALALVPRIARQLGLAEKGFRVVVNTGKEGGQTVGHLHFHILGGRDMQWPPG